MTSFIMIIIIFVLMVSIGYSESVESQPIIKPTWAEAPAPSANLPDNKVWEHLSDNFYYNKTKLTKSSNNISIWTYRIITDDERQYWTEYFRESDLQKSIKYKTLDHQVMFLKFDCKKKLSKIEKLVNYDNKENVLYEETHKDAEWTSIIPNSKLEETYKIICVTQKEQKQKNKPKKKSKPKKRKKPSKKK